MPKTSTSKSKSKRKAHIRQHDARKVQDEMIARGLSRQELWEIRRSAGLYGLFAGDTFKRAYMGGKRTRKN
jgi:hypothetical protein